MKNIIFLYFLNELVRKIWKGRRILNSLLKLICLASFLVVGPLYLFFLMWKVTSGIGVKFNGETQTKQLKGTLFKKNSCWFYGIALLSNLDFMIHKNFWDISLT